MSPSSSRLATTSGLAAFIEGEREKDVQRSSGSFNLPLALTYTLSPRMAPLITRLTHTCTSSMAMEIFFHYRL